MGEFHPCNRISVHQALGAGSIANVLLWRKPFASFALLASSTSLWLLFERAGYNPLTFIANVFLLLVAILFFWAKSASLLNRPLPPVPDLEVSEKSIEQAADVIRVWMNRGLAVAHEIAVCGNLRVLLQVAALLWLISYIGSLCNFVTFVYIGYRKIDATVLCKIPVSLYKKKKKTQ